MSDVASTQSVSIVEKQAAVGVSYAVPDSVPRRTLC